MCDPSSSAARRRTAPTRSASICAVVALILFSMALPAATLAETAKPAPAAPTVLPAPSPGTPPSQTSDADPVLFIRRVLADTEDVWHQLFKQFGQTYREPILVLYSGQTHTACGLGQAISGPFYCEVDRKIYLDLGFFDDLRRRFGAPGDMAQAYIIAHEVAHHVQLLLGIHGKVEQLRRGLSATATSQLLVRQELQADCLAGVWAHIVHKLKNRLEPGDIESGLAAAAAIGNDHLQRLSGQPVTPETFTHGSSAQRVRWLRVGLESGQIKACDTFSQVSP